MPYDRRQFFLIKYPRPVPQYTYYYTTLDPLFNLAPDRSGYHLHFAIEENKITFYDLMSPEGHGIVQTALINHGISFNSCAIDPIGWLEHRILTDKTEIKYGLEFVEVVMQTSGAKREDIDSVLLLVKKDLENNSNWHYEPIRPPNIFLPRFNETRVAKSAGFVAFEIDSLDQEKLGRNRPKT